MRRTDELKPCPFCGGEGKIDGTSWTTRDGKEQAWVTCKKCGAYGPSSTDAIAAWNRRTQEQADDTR
jgi:Lar family restriction alleviation protein